MTRDQAAVQAIARAISEGVIVRCSCGQMETSGSDGRRRHELLYGHRLAGTPKEASQFNERDDDLECGESRQENVHARTHTGTGAGTSLGEVRP